MKNIFNLLLVSALAMLMQSCSKDLVVTDEPNDPEKFEEVQLRLTGEVAYMTPETRLDASGFVNGDLFGVYTTTGKMGPNKNSAPKNAKYVYKNGAIEAIDDDNMIYWEDNKSMKIYAYYPHTSSSNFDNNTNYLFGVKEDQSSAENYYKSDFLRAESDAVAKTSNPVDLTFYHLMSKVSVTITHDDSITDTDFNSATKELTIEGVAISGKINLIARTIEEPTSFGKILKTFADGNTFSAILYPQNKESVKFRLKLGNDYYSSTMDIAYQSGKEYKYTFTVTKNEGALSLKSTNINEWTVGSEITQKMTKETSSN